MNTGNDKINKAMNFAIAKHTNHISDGSKPYLLHIFGVVFSMTIQAGITNPDLVQAAFLHDVGEVGVPIEDVKEEFGEKVASLVAEVARKTHLSRFEQVIDELANVEKKSFEAKILILADKLDCARGHLTGLPDGTPERRIIGHFAYVKSVVDKIRGTNEELEKQLDIVFNSKVAINGKEMDCCPGDTEKWLQEYLEIIKQ